ncbi:right-handed parallel beta-helix repeat-containing protein [Deinococcus aetherius]|uniref:right-handed parallel beta-helix repeat-containing protein n=1 Tax=Deinococcus aetherius TaxID=200252 RepID=UPI00222EB8B6|nr:right-handed parallel beta-helix repeat-containing protein [Deinococcus aetherius]
MGGALFALAVQAPADLTPWQIEAEHARGHNDQPLPTRQGADSAWIISDKAASDGRAVLLASNGGSVGQVLPGSFRPGVYTVGIRARGEAYQGWPTVELRLDGRRVGAVTVTNGEYALQTLANVSLRPGQRLDIVFVNDAYDGAQDRDRNAVLDQLALTPLQDAAPPAGRTPGDVLDVKSFGAKGDGVTDDSAVLARIGNAGGKDIYFPPGTYVIGRPVRLDGLKHQTIYGSNATLRASDDFQAGDALGMLTLTNAQDLTVRDLTIVGRARYDVAPFDQRADGLHVEDSRDVHVRGLNVQRTHSVGISADGSDGVVIEDSTVSGAYANGIGTGNSNNVKILRNTVTGLGDPGSGNYKEPPGLGIFGWGGKNFLAEGNVLRNITNTATKTEGIANTTYRGNTIDGFGKDGIKIMPRPGYSTSVAGAVVEGNTIRNRHPWAADGTSYILFHSVQGGRVAGNKIESTYRPGHFYEEDAVRVNTFSKGPPSRDIVIEGNEIVGTRRGVRLEADGTVFRGNTVRGQDPWARSGLIVSANGVSVANNTFDGPVIGVLLDSGVARTRVENNRFANNSGSGVYADNDNSDTTVGGNSFGVGVAQRVVGRVNGCRSNEC